MAKKCRKCRDKKKSVDFSPSRPPRGSIRKAKRDEMRRIKKEKLQKAREDAEK